MQQGGQSEYPHRAGVKCFTRQRFLGCYLFPDRLAQYARAMAGGAPILGVRPRMRAYGVHTGHDTWIAGES